MEAINTGIKEALDKLVDKLRVLGKCNLMGK